MPFTLLVKSTSLPPGSLEQLEQRRALLLGLRDELVGVADVVLEALLLLRGLAAPDPEEEQQQNEQPAADRDAAADQQRLRVGGRASRRWASRRPGRARCVVAFVEEGQTAASMPLLADCLASWAGRAPAGTNQNLRWNDLSRPRSCATRKRTQRLARISRRIRADAGLVLGRYRLERLLGAGGFGVVWLAHDERLERDVAVKVIPREGEGSGVDRAEREARAAARLNHPGVVGLYELDHDEHSTYLVSELVRGRTFAELARAGALADSDVARIGLALCDALDHAHERGVIHRDVKPQNVMVLAEPDAGAGFAKLADFGVAHLGVGRRPHAHRATWSARSPTWRRSRPRASA